MSGLAPNDVASGTVASASSVAAQVSSHAPHALRSPHAAHALPDAYEHEVNGVAHAHAVALGYAHAGAEQVTICEHDRNGDGRYHAPAQKEWDRD